MTLGHDDSIIYVVICIIIIIIIKAQQHKAAGKKTRLDYKIKMIRTAVYSVTMVLWKETTFPVCRSMERRYYYYYYYYYYF